MRNLCEMYAKVYEAIKKECSNRLFIMFGVFSIVLSFVSFLYAKYAKPIFSIYAGTLTYHVSFRIFAYIFDIGYLGLFL